MNYGDNTSGAWINCLSAYITRRREKNGFDYSDRRGSNYSTPLPPGTPRWDGVPLPQTDLVSHLMVGLSSVQRNEKRVTNLPGPHPVDGSFVSSFR